MGRFNNLATASGAAAAVDILFDDVKDCFQKHGVVEPVCFIFMTVDPTTNGAFEEGVTLGRVDGDMSDPLKIHHFEATVRYLVKVSRAVGVLHIFEALMMEIVDNVPKDAEALDDLLSSTPDHQAKKVVVATFEHLRIKPQVWQADIRDDTNTPTLGEFVDQECDFSVPDSRFTNWLGFWN